MRFSVPAGRVNPGTVRPMSGNRVSYTLDSTLETVNSAEETAGRMAAEAGFDDEDVMKISMAVREAAVNAVCTGMRTARQESDARVQTPSATWSSPFANSAPD